MFTNISRLGYFCKCDAMLIDFLVSDSTLDTSHSESAYSSGLSYWQNKRHLDVFKESPRGVLVDGEPPISYSCRHTLNSFRMNNTERNNRITACCSKWQMRFKTIDVDLSSDRWIRWSSCYHWPMALVRHCVGFVAVLFLSFHHEFMRWTRDLHSIHLAIVSIAFDHSDGGPILQKKFHWKLPSRHSSPEPTYRNDPLRIVNLKICWRNHRHFCSACNAHDRISQ